MDDQLSQLIAAIVDGQGAASAGTSPWTILIGVAVTIFSLAVTAGVAILNKRYSFFKATTLDETLAKMLKEAARTFTPKIAANELTRSQAKSMALQIVKDRAKVMGIEIGKITDTVLGEILHGKVHEIRDETKGVSTDAGDTGKG